MPLSIRRVAASPERGDNDLRARETQAICPHDNHGGNACLGAGAADRLCGGHLRVAFPVAVCAMVFPQENGTAGGPAEYPTDPSDRALQTGAPLRHDPATDL